MYKRLLIVGIALCPFTQGMSLFLSLVAGVALAVDYLWACYDIQFDEEEPIE